jgi:hypothetical protein
MLAVTRVRVRGSEDSHLFNQNLTKHYQTRDRLILTQVPAGH